MATAIVGATLLGIAFIIGVLAIVTDFGILYLISGFCSILALFVLFVGIYLEDRKDELK